MKYSYIAAALLSAGASAFPNVAPELYRRNLAERNIKAAIRVEPNLVKRQTAAQSLSMAETNCGPAGPCLTFNAADQYVSTSGNNAFMPPGVGDIRGLCPGLNAAANYNYLPRNGVVNIVQTITGLGALYNMAVDLAAFLAVYAVVIDGDVITQTWSIGGPPPFVPVLGSLLTPPQGISFSHNKYEGDTSIGRNDAYLNNGDAYSLNVTRFGYAYQSGQVNGADSYTFDDFRRDTSTNQERSIQNNPYYFTGLFSTTLVAPAAYNFIINFMSNHSAAQPSGYLNGAMFKEWFSVGGTYNPNAEATGFGFTWQPGYERIPDNWYRRPSYNQYNAAGVFEDLIIGWAAYPDSFRFGGNTDGVNTYEGIDIASLTGGTYTNGQIISNPTDFACLIFQTQNQIIPDELEGGINKLSAALGLLNEYTGFFQSLECPALAAYDGSVFNQYPGYTYSPTSSGTTGA